MNLSQVTTLRIGGPAKTVVEATTEAELIAAVQTADQAGESLLLVAGGSNLVVADAGFDGTVVLVRTSGISAEVDDCSGALVTVAAGENWDEFVAYAIEQDWAGIEALSGIPGAVGSTPIQNVGAYGQQVSDTITAVRTWDREQGRVRTLMAADLEFGYRTSLFKQTPNRFVVLSVQFQFRLAAGQSAPIRYGELAKSLGVEVGDRAELRPTREAVLGLRRSKAMVLDSADHDTWSAGSFFTNPVLTPAQAQLLPADAPQFVQADGSVKSSAAWLIERAGFAKGYRRGKVGLSTKHTLALTNRGEATAAELLDLAREVRDEVEQVFGIRLLNEPVLVGLSLAD